LRSLLEYQPQNRISAAEALRHAYFRETPQPLAPVDMMQAVMQSLAQEPDQGENSSSSSH
jgi:hypothetical protein